MHGKLAAQAANSRTETPAPFRDDKFLITFDTSRNRPGQPSQSAKATDPFERGGRSSSNKIVDARWLRSSQHYKEGTLLFNHTRARIPARKIWEYLLSTTNPSGKWKAAIFKAIGYTTCPEETLYNASPYNASPSSDKSFRDDGLFLMSQIRENLRHRFVIYEGKDQDEALLRFRVNMVIRSPTGQVAWVETCWVYDLIPAGSENAFPQPRLTTAIPHDKLEAARFIETFLRNQV